MDRLDDPPPPEAPRAPGFLGVQLSERNGRMIIDQVISGSPAEKAGIQKGDTILQYGERPARSIPSIVRAIGKMASGDTLRILLERTAN